MFLRLRPRLAAVASFIPEGTTAADIGTEQAHLPIFLVKEKNCPGVIGIDSSPHNVDAAAEKIKEHNLDDKIELRPGSGLHPLAESDGIDVIVLAGLGGKTICSLLEESRGKLELYTRLVLQPMTDTYLVRRWLVARGFFFPRERLAREKNRFYEIIAAEKGRPAISDPFLLELGPTLLQEGDPLLFPFLQEKLKQYEKVL